MRSFTKGEKKLVREIARQIGKDYLFENTFIFQLGYSVGYEYSTGNLLYYGFNSAPTSEEMNRTLQKFYELCFLLKSLKGEGLIYPLYYQCKPLPFINPPQNQNVYTVSVPTEIKAIMDEFQSKVIYATEGLKWLVENDFKTHEQQSIEEDRKQTKVAIIAMFATCLVGLHPILKEYIDSSYLLSVWTLIFWAIGLITLIFHPQKVK